MNEQGVLIALVWNVAGRSQLSFYDVYNNKLNAGTFIACGDCRRN